MKAKNLSVSPFLFRSSSIVITAQKPASEQLKIYDGNSHICATKSCRNQKRMPFLLLSPSIWFSSGNSQVERSRTDWVISMKSHRHTTQDSQWMIFTCHFWQPTNLKVTVINLALSSKCHLVIHETAEQVMILCSRFFFHSCVPIEFVLMTLRKRTNRIPPLPPWWWHNSPFCFFLFSICHWLPLESWHSFI